MATVLALPFFPLSVRFSNVHTFPFSLFTVDMVYGVNGIVSNYYCGTIGFLLFGIGIVPESIC